MSVVITAEQQETNAVAKMAIASTDKIQRLIEEMKFRSRERGFRERSTGNSPEKKKVKK